MTTGNKKQCVVPSLQASDSGGNKVKQVKDINPPFPMVKNLNREVMEGFPIHRFEPPETTINLVNIHYVCIYTR